MSKSGVVARGGQCFRRRRRVKTELDPSCCFRPATDKARLLQASSRAVTGMRSGSPFYKGVTMLAGQGNGVVCRWGKLRTTESYVVTGEQLVGSLMPMQVDDGNSLSLLSSLAPPEVLVMLLLLEARAERWRCMCGVQGL